MEKSYGFEMDYFSGKGFQSKGLHRHQFNELIFVIEGKLNFLVDDKLYKADGSCIILFKKGRLHTSEVDEGCVYTRYNVNFHRRYVNDIANPDKLIGCFSSDCTVIPLDKEQCNRFKLLFDELYNNYETVEKCGYSEEICRHMLTVILMQMSKLAENYPNLTGQYIDSSYVSDAVKYINGNITTKLLISDIADALFVSRTKLINDFKASTGITVGDYVISQRLKMAKKLLVSGKDVASAASGSGFMNTCHFIRTFKKHNGITPLQYARKHSKDT
jgi:AraC-like DNA-binding protein